VEERNGTQQNPTRTGKKLEDWIKRDGSAPLTFRAAGSEGGVTLKPQNQLWGRYATYWTVS
jgi:hypothetical protein